MAINYNSNDVNTSGVLTAVSGVFLNSLTLNGTGVSVKVQDIVAGTNVTVSSVSGIYTINSTASGVGGGGGGVVVENSGNDRILTSTGSSSGINAEANLTFNGSVLNVTGTGLISSRLGISHSAPGFPLDVSGVIRSSSYITAATDFRLNNQAFTRVAHGDSNGAFVGGYNVYVSGLTPLHNSSGSLSACHYHSDGSIRFLTNSGQATNTIASEKMRINSLGNVGINTSTPSGLLHLNSGDLYLGPSYGLRWLGGSRLYEQTVAAGGTERLLYQPNGDRFEILTEAGSEFIAGFHGSGSALSNSIRLHRPVGIGNNYAQSGSLPTNGLAVQGNVGIKTQSPTADLHVNGSGYFASGCSVSGILNVQTIKQTVASGTDAATITFNMNTANVHTVTLGGNRTLAVSNVDVGQRFTIRLKQDASPPRTVTWFSGIYWPSAKPPILTRKANAVDVFSFICTASGKYDGYIVGYNFPNA